MASIENAAPGAADDAEAAVEELPEGAERTSWGEVKHRGQCRYPWCRNPAEASEATTGRPAGFCDLELPDGRRAHTKGTAFRERKRLEAEASGAGLAAPATVLSDVDETRPHQTASLRGAALLDAVRAEAKAEHAAAASRLAKWEHLVEQLETIADPEAAGVDIETVRSAAAEEVARAQGELAKETKARRAAEEKLRIAQADKDEAEAAIVEFDAEKAEQLAAAAAAVETAEAQRAAAQAEAERVKTEADAAVAAAAEEMAALRTETAAQVEQARAEAEQVKTKAGEDIAAAAEANRVAIEAVRAEAAAAVKAAEQRTADQVKAAEEVAEAKVAEAVEAARKVTEQAAADAERARLDADTRIAAARSAQVRAEQEQARAETRAEMEKTAAEKTAAAHAEQLDQLRSAAKATADAITATAKANEDRAIRAEAEADRLSKQLEQLRAQADKPEKK